jgi:hypothetical protein
MYSTIDTLMYYNLEGDNLLAVELYYLSASEIWLDKRSE